MKAILKLFIFSIILTSCGRHYKPIPFEGNSTSSLTDSLVLLPSNSVGTTETQDILDAKKSSVKILASKEYNPIQYNDGWYFIDAQSTFEIPEFLNVLSGRAGNYFALASIKRNEIEGPDDLPKNLNCIYVGTGDNSYNDYLFSATPYEFSFCVDGDTIVTEDNLNTLKAGPENILDETERSGKIFQFKRGDKIAIHIHNGNSAEDDTHQYISTEVEYIIKKTKI